jgi:hypothetical protein
MQAGVKLEARHLAGRSLASLALVAACSGHVEERGRSAAEGGTAGNAVGAVGGSLGDAGRASSGGNLGVGGSLGAYGSGGSSGDAGAGGILVTAGRGSGGTSSGTGGRGSGGTTSGTGGSSGTGGACPRMPSLCSFEPGCLNPHSPSPEHVPRNPPIADAGTGDAAISDAAAPVESGPRDAGPVARESAPPPVFTVSANLCGDAGAAPDPSYLAFDVVNKWTSMPAVAVLSGITPCGGVPLGQVAVPTPDGVPWGARVTHCVRVPRELGTILTLVPIHATEIMRPRFVSGCECPRVLTPSSSVCSIEVPEGGSPCESEP